MRTLKKYWAVLMLTCLAFGLAGTEKAMAHGGTYVSFQTFYDELSPYGRWINYPGHGYVWAPDVEADFQPYATRGYWVVTEYGNTWVSDYAWGWAPFHYGRWLWDDFIGWVWVPGNEWGPAWVNWRSGSDYYGWAPLGPGMQVNIYVNIPVNYWVFVPRRHIMSRSIYSYCVPRPTVVNVYNHTTIINNYYTNNNRTYVYGPRVQDIRHDTRSRVPVYRVNQNSRPGRAVVDKGSVRIYRPDVTDKQNEAPARVVTREHAPRQERSSNTNDNFQGRIDRSSTSGNATNPSRERTAEATGIPNRESFTDRRRSTTEPELTDRRATGRENAPERGADISREVTPERTRSISRETVAEPRTNTADLSRARESRSTRPETPVFERSTGTAPDREVRPTPERVERERPQRTTQQPAFERPAGTEMPVRRETTQPEMRQSNPGVRTEQPAARPTQRSMPESAAPARSQYSQPHQQERPAPVQPQRQERVVQPQPQRPGRDTQTQPQQQEASPAAAPTRRSRN